MKVTTRKGKSYVKLEGELTVSRAEDFKDALVKSLDKADEVEINLDDVTGIDLSCLQLMCSAHLTAFNKGKTLAIKDPSSSVFMEARKTAGFIYSKPCQHVSSDGCIWVGEGEE